MRPKQAIDSPIQPTLVHNMESAIAEIDGTSEIGSNSSAIPPGLYRRRRSPSLRTQRSNPFLHEMAGDEFPKPVV
jgi:hypothetical protein